MSARPEVLLLDSGMGNLRSVERALERAGSRVVVSGDPERIPHARRLVVPGQGAFRHFAAALHGGMDEAIREHVARGRPYLGICLGMQVLFERSEEGPECEGLGIIPGEVKRLALRGQCDADGRQLKVPHMGWNEVRSTHALLPACDWFYFVHSYYCVPDDSSWVVAQTEYPDPFCVAVGRDNLFACQFHPEKSQSAGADLLRRFVEDAWS